MTFWSVMHHTSDGGPYSSNRKAAVTEELMEEVREKGTGEDKEELPRRSMVED